MSSSQNLVPAHSIILEYKPVWNEIKSLLKNKQNKYNARKILFELLIRPLKIHSLTIIKIQ